MPSYFTNQQRGSKPIGEDSDKRFRRSNRLTTAGDYSRVFRHPQRSRDNYFTVLCRPTGSTTTRLGLAISKKHCRLATGRNRIKRLARESFRQHRDYLKGLDIVVMNTRATHGADNATLRDSLSRHWRRCRSRATRDT